MRKKLFHTIIVIGAIINFISMQQKTDQFWIVLGTTVLYVLLFEGIYLLVEPRLIQAEQKGNTRKYPLLSKLITSKRAIVKTVTGETYYNAAFAGYPLKKDASTIALALHKPKQAKKEATTEIIHLAITAIVEVKEMKS